MLHSRRASHLHERDLILQGCVLFLNFAKRAENSDLKNSQKIQASIGIPVCSFGERLPKQVAFFQPITDLFAKKVRVDPLNTLQNIFGLGRGREKSRTTERPWGPSSP